MRGRETPIDLVGDYELVWRDYRTLEGERNGRFRYLGFDCFYSALIPAAART